MTLLDAATGIDAGTALGGGGLLTILAVMVTNWFKNSKYGKQFAEAEEKRQLDADKRRVEDEARRADELALRKDELEVKRQQLALISKLSEVLPQVAKDFGAAIADLHTISRDLRETVVLMKKEEVNA